MKIKTTIAILLALIVISGCIDRTTTTTTTTVATTIPTTTVATTSLEISPVENETFCTNDGDCGCGVHIETGDCFYGNIEYVDVTRQCPDFCSGFAGNLRITCIDNECKQVPWR